MAIIMRRSPGYFTGSSHVFAILLMICLLLSTEMTAAWKRDMCIPGDVYIGSQNGRPQGRDCNFCEKWCFDECDDLELPAISYACRLDGVVKCKCCCGRSSSSSPSSSLPALLPQPDSEFVGPWPHDINICKAEEKYIKIKHKDGRHCVKKPSCEETCKKNGLFLTREECGAGGEADPNVNYLWYEQCCCGKVKPPPPPSPPPPPPPPPSLPPPPTPQPSPTNQWCPVMPSCALYDSCDTTQPKPSPLPPPSPPPPPPSPPPPPTPQPSPTPQWCPVMPSCELYEYYRTTPPKPSPLPPPPFQTSFPPTPRNMCRLEDIYVAFSHRGGCGICTSECETKCSGIDSSMVMQRCTLEPWQLCECCCKNNSPSGAPRASPPPQPISIIAIDSSTGASQNRNCKKRDAKKKKYVGEMGLGANLY